MESKTHWETIYKTKAPTEVSWYQEFPTKSLDMIKAAGVSKDASIIDVGGGASSLADHLVRAGYKSLWVLDIASAALEKAKSHLGPNAEAIHWIVGDITQVVLPYHYFGLWHDRAVFHFLTREEDRQRYKEALVSSLKPGGHLIISTFALEGPSHCSGLDVQRYSPESLATELGPNFRLVEASEEDHSTPFDTYQRFIYCRFQRAA